MCKPIAILEILFFFTGVSNVKYNQLTTKQFTKKAKHIHGDKYDYSDTKYVSTLEKVAIKCNKHGIFEQIAGNHINPKIQAGCPYCARKKVYKGETDLESQFPEIAKLFNIEMNENKPSEVFAHTNKKYWWNCDNGLPHKYEMSVNNKVGKKYGCPICSGQQLLSGFNDLQTRYPDFASEWDYAKNEGTPTDYRYGSGYTAWWVCKNCGESYQSPINVHIKGHKCPYCAGKKVAIGRTDLQSLFPNVAKEYADDNKVPSNKIAAGSHTKVKWICPNCNEEYFASPHHRTSKDKTECPLCKKQSKGEKLIKSILDKHGITYKTQEWFDDLRSDSGRPLMFDFTLYQNNRWVGAIEYNGKQHYEPVDIFGGYDSFRKQQEKDAKKIVYCLQKGIPILSVAYKRCGMTVEQEINHFISNLFEL